MSIDPTRSVPVSPPSVADARRSPQSKESFLGELEAAAARRSAASPEVTGPMLAQALQLRMLSASLTLDSSFDENEVIPTQRLLDELVRRYSVAGPNADTPAAVRPSPPSSQAPSLAGKSDSIDAIVSRAAARYQLAPELVRAVIRAESSFNPQAVSPAGAQGLMQLMPGTARDMGVEDPFDPEQNVMGGTRYLRKMLDRYEGNLEKALAAYNWGPGNLDRSDGSFLPRETREYLARIQRFLSREG